MKITLDIPDWVSERDIYIFAGIELVAYKNFDSDQFNVKTSRCNMCGYCCKDTPYNFKTVNGMCEFYNKDLGCSLGILRPFGCCVGDPYINHDTEILDHCSIRY